MSRGGLKLANPSKLMKTPKTMALVTLAMMLTSCATPPPPQVFHNTDGTALVIESLDDTTCQVLQPVVSAKEKIDEALSPKQWPCPNIRRPW